MTGAAILISLALTASGPQIYQSGHVPGWQVEVAMFQDNEAHTLVVGPTRHGRPAHPIAKIGFNGHPRDSWIWTSANNSWTAGAALFNGPHDQQAGTARNLAPFWIPPWPAKPATITPIYHHPKESQ